MVLFISFRPLSKGPSLSGPQHTYVGVPQGSILGPLLFLIFINDLFLVIKNDVDFFANDSTISLAGHKLSTIESSSQSDLKNIEKWCQVNKMIINVEKTKAMVISTKQKQTRSIDNFNLNLIMYVYLFTMLNCMKYDTNITNMWICM